MNEKIPLAASFSQEELFVILRYLDVPSLMGLNNDVWESVEEDVAALILSVAERALIARNFLVVNAVQNRFELVSPILALVGTCVKPDYSLVMTANRPGKPSEGFFFHLAGQMVVLHTIPISGIHQFVALPDKAAIEQAVLSTFPLDMQTVPEGRTSILPQELLVQARNVAAEGSVTEALAVLEQADLDPETSHALAVTLATAKVNTTLVYLDQRNTSKTATAGFTILGGENGLWQLQPAVNGTTNTKIVRLTPLAVSALPSAVQSLLGSVK